MDDMPFGLARKDTYAALSAADLESLGKEAASLFLCDGVSLNESVIKVARQHPSISPHQVKRVVEYANTDTFQRLFEKQAGDKNIDFDVADPGTILRNLDLGARGGVMTPQPDEYSSAPVKLAHEDVEADIQLAEMFGVDIKPPTMDKTASISNFGPSPLNRAILGVLPLPPPDNPVDRILMAKEAMGGVAGAPLMAGPASEAVGESTEQTHHDQMLEMTRSIELEKKKQELIAIQQKTLQSMGQPPGAEGGMPGEGASPAPPPEVAAAMQEAPTGGPMGGPAAGPPGGPMEVGPQSPTAPVQGPVPEKLGSMIKSAMNYAKSGRPQAGLVLADLAESTSLERIKEATADRNPEPEANPYGPLFRARHMLTKLAEDATTARDRNAYFIKDAAERWCHEVVQHVLREDDGFGVVVHAMSHVDGSEDSVKMAMSYLIPHLESKGIDVAPLQAQTIRYEMEKGASRRQVNPANPIVQSYATLIKLGDGQRTMETAADRLLCELTKVDEAIKEAACVTSL